MLRLVFIIFLLFFISCDKEDKDRQEANFTKLNNSAEFSEKEQDKAKIFLENEAYILGLEFDCKLNSLDENTSLYCIDSIFNIQDKKSKKVFSLKDAFIELSEGLTKFSFSNAFYSYQLSFKDEIYSLKITNLKENSVELEDYFTSLDEEVFFKDEPEFVDLNKLFFASNVNLEESLFNAANLSGKKLFSKDVKWELWRKNIKENDFLYNLSNHSYYIYKDGYLSDEFSVSLHKKDDLFYLGVNTPRHFKHALIQDFFCIDDIFVFKFDERNFIFAKVDEDFVNFYEAKLGFMGLDVSLLTFNSYFNFSKNDLKYEMFLSEEGCEDCEQNLSSTDFNPTSF